jgi:hypothetical protein
LRFFDELRPGIVDEASGRDGRQLGKVFADRRVQPIREGYSQGPGREQLVSTPRGENTGHTGKNNGIPRGVVTASV